MTQHHRTPAPQGPARCDNTSVGVIITNHDGKLLMFERATWPVGVAGAAGHVDEHGTYADAARAEVAEELGLTVTGLTPLTSSWRSNRCRRPVGPHGIGHQWEVFFATVTGTLTPSARETRNAHWITPADVQALTDRTTAYAAGRISDEQFAERPGVEPVWVAWLHLAKIITVAPADLARIDALATVGAHDGRRGR